MRKSDPNPLPPPHPGAGAASEAGGLSPRLWSLIANLPVPFVIVAIVLLGRLVLTPDRIGGDVHEIVMQVGVAIVMAVSLQLINGFGGQFSLGHAGFMAVGAYLSGYPSVAYSRDLSDPAAVLLFYVALLTAAGIGAGVLIAFVVLASKSGGLLPSLGAVLMELLFAWILVDVSAAGRHERPPAYLLFTHGVGLLTALFGGMVGGGADAAAAASARCRPGRASRSASSCCSAAADSARRRRGSSSACRRSASAAITSRSPRSASPRSSASRSRTPTRSAGRSVSAASRPTPTSAGCTGRRVRHDRRDRPPRLLRQGPRDPRRPRGRDRRAATGVDPTHHKVLGFVVGSFFAGVGGVLYAHYTGFITPSPQEFGLVRSIEFVVMVVLGGLGSITARGAGGGRAHAPDGGNVDDLLPPASAPGLPRLGVADGDLQRAADRHDAPRPQACSAAANCGRGRRRRHGGGGGGAGRGFEVVSPVKDSPEPETAAL